MLFFGCHAQAGHAVLSHRQSGPASRGATADQKPRDLSRGVPGNDGLVASATIETMKARLAVLLMKSSGSWALVTPSRTGVLLPFPPEWSPAQAGHAILHRFLNLFLSRISAE